MIQGIIDKAKKEHKKVYIYAHKFPDGDAITSSCALALYLKNQGIDAKYVISNPIYSFKQIVGEIPTTHSVEENSISIILDTNTLMYCENNFFSSSMPQDIYVIDHHPKTENTNCIEDQLRIPIENVIRDSESSSTSEILLNEFSSSKISPEIANMLTVGLITDTARLQFLKENTLQNLIKLINLGVNYEQVLSLCTRKKLLREEVGLANLLLYTQQLQIGNTFGLLIHADNKTVNDMNNQYRLRNLQKKIFKMADITNCSFTCISAENTPGEFDLEFRSTPIYGNLDVLKLATKHDGGGHYHASGCHLSQTETLSNQTIPTFIQEEIKELYSLETTNLEKTTLTDIDNELAQILEQTNRLSKNVTAEILIKVDQLIKQGANYTYTYKKFKTFERFMLENEILSKIPESTFSQKFPIVSIYLSKQDIDTLCTKYKITEEDILKTIDVFANIDVKFASISISGGKRIQIDKYGNITISNSAGKKEKIKEVIR